MTTAASFLGDTGPSMGGIALSAMVWMHG
jgi:hypothetical protein